MHGLMLKRPRNEALAIGLDASTLAKSMAGTLLVYRAPNVWRVTPLNTVASMDGLTQQCHALTAPLAGYNPKTPKCLEPKDVVHCVKL